MPFRKRFTVVKKPEKVARGALKRRKFPFSSVLKSDIHTPKSSCVKTKKENESDLPTRSPFRFIELVFLSVLQKKVYDDAKNKCSCDSGDGNLAEVEGKSTDTDDKDSGDNK